MANISPRKNLAAERRDQGLPPKITDGSVLAKVAVFVVATNKGKAA